MKITVATSAGFCFGVQDAIEMAFDAAEKQDGDVWMLGDIVHNEQVVKDIHNAGVKVVKNLGDVSGGTLLLRAHGTVPQVYEEAHKRGLNVIDATCPLVSEIHEVARGLEADGYHLVIIGDHGHDEVVGIAGQVKEATVVANPEEARNIRRIKRAGVVVQSTQDINNVKSIIPELISRCQEIKFINTICGPTRRHQNEIRTMPLENDAMVIVGSFTSANTCRLTQISTSLNPRSRQVQSAEDLDPTWFEGAETVGISAGASTPDRLIREVAERIASFKPGSEIVNSR